MLLIDLHPLFPSPKIIPPHTHQLPNESLRFWAPVTAAIKSKRFTEATKLKQELEERQREKATQRKERGVEWKPRFFREALTGDGRPELTEEGRRALEGMQREEFALEESEITGA